MWIAKNLEGPFESPGTAAFFDRYRSKSHRWLNQLIDSHPLPHIRTQAACVLFIDIVSRGLAFVAIGLMIFYSVFIA